MGQNLCFVLGSTIASLCQVPRRHVTRCAFHNQGHVTDNLLQGLWRGWSPEKRPQMPVFHAPLWSCIFIYWIKNGFQEVCDLTVIIQKGNDLKDDNTMIKSFNYQIISHWRSSTIHIRTQTGSMGCLLKTIVTWLNFSLFCGFSLYVGITEALIYLVLGSELLKVKPAQLF